MISFKRLTLIFSIFVFTACGGGGGGGASTPETPPQNVTITFTISATQINLGQSVTLIGHLKMLLHVLPLEIGPVVNPHQDPRH